MRAVGQQLGRTAMSLYTYVPGRDVLVALMYDRAHGEATSSRGRLGWRKAVMAWSTDLRDLYFRHPWVLEISQARPVFGPHEQEVLERLLAILAGEGTTASDRRAVTSALFSIVRESAKRKAEAAAESEHGAEWWAGRAEALQAVAPDFATRFPESVALSHDQSELGPKPWIKAAEDAFRDAVTLLLDGLEPRLTAS
ncbi:TetR/AcrR family transcriptional regulator [Kribbella qitaiheensis]|uniref:TetR/AcrR family transcriptional regulator n=2 Tax=Kribbella qitaiheensis TaxID=1544730 RepID=A0A7G6X9J9_9ACTN|nr:TetR/AcrR family transcriptional regulator [Kribbella qitaiheensis]